VTVKIDLPKEEHVVIASVPNQNRQRDPSESHFEEECKDQKLNQRDSQLKDKKR